MDGSSEPPQVRIGYFHHHYNLSHILDNLLSKTTIYSGNKYFHIITRHNFILYEVDVLQMIF